MSRVPWPRQYNATYDGNIFEWILVQIEELKRKMAAPEPPPAPHRRQL